VKPGVHHHAAGAEGQALQIAQLAHRIAVIGAQFIAQLLGIESPALGIGIERQERADQRQADGIFALPDVAGDPFMEAQRCHAEAGVAGRRLIQILPGIEPSIEPAPP